MFINFGVTDHTAHTNKWELYPRPSATATRSSACSGKKYNRRRGYKDATTLVFTTDHGRHDGKLVQLKGGFASTATRAWLPARLSF